MQIHKNHLSKQKLFKKENYFQIKTFGKIVSRILTIKLNKIIYLIINYLNQPCLKLII
jgi:hypothetical protein